MKILVSSPLFVPATRVAAGFSLLEVLVALVIISISLLGIAGMQAISIANTHESGFRSLAATQASSLQAMMAVNDAYWQTSPVPAQATTTGTALNPIVTIGTTAQTSVSDCVASACTPAQLAIYDLQQWQKGVAGLLPSGSGAVSCSNGGGAVATCLITVSWFEKSLVQNSQDTSTAGNAGTTAQLEVVVQP